VQVPCAPLQLLRLSAGAPQPSVDAGGVAGGRDASREAAVPKPLDEFDFSIAKFELAYLPEEREVLALLGGYEATV
jgi:hypothetical protein